MVRPAGFEPAASWFVVKRYWTQGFLFNSMVSADMPHFGPFGANWVGIWVGVFRAPRYRLGQVVPQRRVVQLEMRTWFEDSSADWPPLHLQHRPNRSGVLSQPPRYAWGAMGTLYQLGGQGVIRQDRPEWDFRARIPTDHSPSGRPSTRRQPERLSQPLHLPLALPPALCPPAAGLKSRQAADTVKMTKSLNTQNTNFNPN